LKKRQKKEKENLREEEVEGESGRGRRES